MRLDPAFPPTSQPAPPPPPSRLTAEAEEKGGGETGESRHVVVYLCIYKLVHHPSHPPMFLSLHSHLVRRLSYFKLLASGPS